MEVAIDCSKMQCIFLRKVQPTKETDSGNSIDLDCFSVYLDHVAIQQLLQYIILSGSRNSQEEWKFLCLSVLLAAYSRKEISDNEFQKYREYIACSWQGFEIWTCYTCQTMTDGMHLNTMPMPLLPSCFYNPISCDSQNSKITRG